MAAPAAGCRCWTWCRATEPLRKVYEPGHPMANADGMVFYPNVNQVAEMTDMMSASRAFETNVEVLGRIKSMQQSLLKFGEGVSHGRRASLQTAPAAARPATPSPRKNNATQDMFTKLLVAQIRNQDPLAPTDPSQFVNQLTQLAQTEAMQNLSTLTSANASVLQSMQVLALGAQVGSEVMVDTTTVQLDGNKVNGSMALTANSTKTTLTLTDAAGKAIHDRAGRQGGRQRAVHHRPGKTGHPGRHLHDGRDHQQRRKAGGRHRGQAQQRSPVRRRRHDIECRQPR